MPTILFSTVIQAVKKFLKIDGSGSADDLYWRGIKYIQGRRKDDAEAVKWFRLAADQGHPAAHYRLGGMYEDGQGVPKDEAEAAKWFRLDADQGGGHSASHLAVIYENGQGVAKDEAEALRWYKKAAKQGIIDHSLLSQIYDH